MAITLSGTSHSAATRRWNPLATNGARGATRRTASRLWKSRATRSALEITVLYTARALALERVEWSEWSVRWICSGRVESSRGEWQAAAGREIHLHIALTRSAILMIYSSRLLLFSRISSPPRRRPVNSRRARHSTRLDSIPLESLAD